MDLGPKEFLKYQAQLQVIPTWEDKALGWLTKQGEPVIQMRNIY